MLGETHSYSPSLAQNSSVPSLSLSFVTSVAHVLQDNQHYTIDREYRSSNIYFECTFVINNNLPVICASNIVTNQAGHIIEVKEEISQRITVVT